MPGVAQCKMEVLLFRDEYEEVWCLGGSVRKQVEKRLFNVRFNEAVKVTATGGEDPR